MLNIVSFILEGYKDAADRFEIETGIVNSTHSETVNERIRIRDAVESGRIKEAIQMINSLYPEIIDNNRQLAFHLQVRKAKTKNDDKIISILFSLVF